jgi:hypothetical protein
MRRAVVAAILLAFVACGDTRPMADPTEFELAEDNAKPPPSPNGCPRQDISPRSPRGMQALWTGDNFLVKWWRVEYRFPTPNDARTDVSTVDLRYDDDGQMKTGREIRLPLSHVWMRDGALLGLTIEGSRAQVRQLDTQRQPVLETYRLPEGSAHWYGLLASTADVLPSPAGVWLVTGYGRVLLLHDDVLKVDTWPQPQSGQPREFGVYAEQASVDAQGALHVVLTRYYDTEYGDREQVERVLTTVFPDGRVRTRVWPDTDFRPNQLIAVEDGFLLVGARVYPWPEPRRQFQHLGGRIVRLDADWNVLETVDVDADVGCEVANGDALTRLTRVPDGWLATGRACHQFDGIYDLWWVKLNAQLAVQRQARIALNDQNYQFSVAVADTGALALAGGHLRHGDGSYGDEYAPYFMFVDPEWTCLSEPGGPPQSEGTQP